MARRRFLPILRAMPHITLEYSANAVGQVDVQAVLQALHTALLEFEGFALEDLKSRVHCYETYRVGDAAPLNAFVHLSMALLQGRDISVRQRITERCLQILQDAFVPASPGPQDPFVNVSVELREMERATYGKVRASGMR
jgi:5-carboxymethyl-2-hydroxymuconate isomerase